MCLVGRKLQSPKLSKLRVALSVGLVYSFEIEMQNSNIVGAVIEIRGSLT